MGCSRPDRTVRSRGRIATPVVLPLVLALFVILAGSTRVIAGSPHTLHTAVVNANDVASIDLPTTVNNHEPVRGFSFGLSHDGSLFTLTGIVPGDGIAAANGGAGPDLFLVDIAPGPGPGGTVEALISLDPQEAIPAFSGPVEIVKFQYDLLPGGPNGFSAVQYDEALGVPTLLELSDPPGELTVPFQVGGGIVYHQPPSSPIGDAGDQLWFLNGGDGTISVVSLDGVLLDTLSGGGQLGPSGVAVGPEGITWITFRDSDAVVRFDLTGTVIDVIPVGDGPVGIALDSEGSAWVANSLENTLTKIAADGVVLLGGDASDPVEPGDGVLGGAVPTASGPQGLAVDGLDNVAVACTTADSIEKFNSDGALVWTVLLPPGSAPTGVAVDRDLYIWVTSSTSGRVERRASDGSPAEVFDDALGAGPRAITIRGRDEAWVVGPQDGTLRRYRPGGEATAFAIGGTPSGVAADGRGDLWVTDKAAGTVSRYGPEGTLEDTIAIGPEPEFLGDAFGLAPANVLLPTLDFDDDGSRNDVEIDQFTNPYDDAEVPTSIPGFVAPVLDLVCQTEVQDVSLMWSAPGGTPIEGIEVRRDGNVIATLPPAGTSFAESSPLPIGTYAYSVIAFDAMGAESLATGCTVVIGAGSLRSSTPIQVPGLAVNLFGIAAVPDPPAGGIAYYLTDPGNDLIYGVDAAFGVLSQITSPFAGLAPTTGIVFDEDGNGGLGSLVVCAGANGDPNQDATVVEIALDGSPIGDPYVLVRPVAGLEGDIPIKGGLGGLTSKTDTSDGSIDSDLFMAVSPENCELFSFRLDPATVGVLPPQAIEIIPAASAFHPDPGYGLNGIEFPPFTPFDENGGEVLVSTLNADGEFEISRLQISGGNASIIAASAPLAALDQENVFGDFVVEGDRVAAVGITTSSVHELGSAFFVRGNANESASGGELIDIGDAVEILQVCFMGVPARPCVDAYDVDDDGMLGVGDAIGLLSYLFNDGSPPVVPFPDPGPDPTPDGLPCF